MSQSNDVIVVIPGVMGSTLIHEGVEIWGVNKRSVVSSLVSLGRNFSILKLPDGIGHDEPDDGIVPGRLLPSTAIIPGFWNVVDGYTELVHELEGRLRLSRPSHEAAGNLIEFPYDWRLSNQLNAKRLAERVVPELERWRKQSKDSDAKLVFICHSMGGLIARWFIEVLGGSKLTRKLITIGTPYRGSIKILDFLSNGFNPGIGRLRAHLGPIIQSMPSAYQVLPSFRCIEDGSGEMKFLSESDVPNVSSANVSEGLSFSKTIQAHVGTGADYEIFALKGIAQPTFQYASISGHKLTSHKLYGADDIGGDGTVPRHSASPPEWTSDARSSFFGCQHGALQAQSDVLRQLFGIITSEIRSFLGGDRLGLEMPDLVPFGSNLEVVVTAESGDPSLPLRASVTSESDFTSHSAIMRSEGDGSYHVEFSHLGPGLYHVTVESADPLRSIDLVKGLTVIWDENADELKAAF